MLPCPQLTRYFVLPHPDSPGGSAVAVATNLQYMSLCDSCVAQVEAAYATDQFKLAGVDVYKEGGGAAYERAGLTAVRKRLTEAEMKALRERI